MPSRKLWQATRLRKPCFKTVVKKDKPRWSKVFSKPQWNIYTCAERWQQVGPKLSMLCLYPQICNPEEWLRNFCCSGSVVLPPPTLWNWFILPLWVFSFSLEWKTLTEPTSSCPLSLILSTTQQIHLNYRVRPSFSSRTTSVYTLIIVSLHSIQVYSFGTTKNLGWVSKTHLLYLSVTLFLCLFPLILEQTFFFS